MDEEIMDEEIMDEEIIRLDLKQAREQGFEYYATYEPSYVTSLSDDFRAYKNDYIVVIMKRRIVTSSKERRAVVLDVGESRGIM